MFLTIDRRALYGSHKGKCLAAIDTQYLQWAVRNMDSLTADERSAISAEILNRSSRFSPGGNRWSRAYNRPPSASLTYDLPPLAQVIDVTPLRPHNLTKFPIGTVRALAVVRKGGAVIRDCRLVLTAENIPALYGPQIQMSTPDRECPVYKTLVSFTPEEEVYLGKMAVEFLGGALPEADL